MNPIIEFSLKNYNTFGFNVPARYFAETHSESELREALLWAAENNTPVLPIGGGSNLLLTEPVEALVLQQKNAEIHLIEESNHSVILHASAAVSWHDLVLYCVDHDYYGIENLSLIPGNVGAAPVQNIGAYGVELADVLVSADVMQISTGECSKLSRDECEFAYRESAFKNTFKGRYIITGVHLKLSKIKQFNLSYMALKNALDAVDEKDLTLKKVSDTVCQIRSSKLPNPNEIGNAGSFFKNPKISHAELLTAQATWPALPFHQQSDGDYKVPAAWMVEKSGWKGYQYKGVGVHRLQSIVLVNFGNGSGLEILELAHLITEDVWLKFGVRLEIEPVRL